MTTTPDTLTAARIIRELADDLETAEAGRDAAQARATKLEEENRALCGEVVDARSELASARVEIALLRAGAFRLVPQ